MIIYPTHTCFDDALELLVEAIKANPGAGTSDELKLVHGICVAPDGHDYSHAWVESLGKHCWFVGIVDGERKQFMAMIDEFYEHYQVKDVTKYTPRQAAELNRQFATYGPWEDRYKTLCNRGRVLYDSSKRKEQN